MFKEFPKALYKGGAWDGVSEPDCVTVGNMPEQTAQVAHGYFPIGEPPAAPPDPQPPKASEFQIPVPDAVEATQERRKPGRPRKET